MYLNKRVSLVKQIVCFDVAHFPDKKGKNTWDAFIKKDGNWMYNVTVFLIFVFVAWRWGDWRNWTKYHSTILFLIIFHLLYNFLCYNHTLWKYEPDIIFPNHTITSLFVFFIIHPSVILVYLGQYLDELNRFYGLVSSYY
jgi:hypothetical protein